jgi:hypothetical protein
VGADRAGVPPEPSGHRHDGWLWWESRLLARAERSPVSGRAGAPVCDQDLARCGYRRGSHAGGEPARARGGSGTRPGVLARPSRASCCIPPMGSSRNRSATADGALEEGLQLHVLRCLSGHFDEYRDSTDAIAARRQPCLHRDLPQLDGTRRWPKCRRPSTACARRSPPRCGELGDDRPVTQPTAASV